MKEVLVRLFSITHNKIEPIYRFCKTLIGRRRGQRHSTPPFCEMWIGISAEENARRCKPSQEGWVRNGYPPRARTESRGLRDVAVEAPQHRCLEECVSGMSYVESLAGGCRSRAF